MKRNLSRILALAAAAIFLASAASAQTFNVRAQVPFDFVLGDNLTRLIGAQRSDQAFTFES
jgi:hypothetical protein